MTPYTKHLNLWRYAAGNIQVYRGRTFAIILFIGISIALLSSINFLREGINQDINSSLGLSPDILIQGYAAGRTIPINSSLASLIESVDGVELVIPRIWGYLSASDKLYLMMGLNFSIYPLDDPELGFILSKGRMIGANENHSTCIIGSGVAEASRAQVGSWLLIEDINGDPKEFEVVGIFTLNSKIYTHDLILTDIESARSFFQLPEGLVTDLTVWTTEDNSDFAIAPQIDDLIDDVRILDKETLGNLLHHSTNERAGYFVIVWTLILLGTILFCFSISSAISLDSRREVGLLKTLGYSITDILEIRFVEFALTGIWASLIGYSSAIFFTFYLGAPILADFMLGWSSLFTPFVVPLKITFESLLVAFGLGTIPLLIATIIPAWNNAIIEPDEILRGV
ncbi:MAG: ABC transporter permease [Candidatus Hodarchaeales archaeon]